MLWPLIATAGEIAGNPDNYRELLKQLRPGDTLVLAPGTYTRGLPVNGTRGLPDARVEVRGPDDRSAVFVANSCCNTVQLVGVAYLTIRNLTLDGGDTNDSFGVDSRGPSHDVTLENLEIVNHGAGQQTVGISTKGPAWNWVIRRNRIIGAGTGMYLGNSDGTAPFVNGLIEYNVVLDTRGYNLQIKHQQPRPSDVGLPTAESQTIIRHNVWSKRRNASSGSDARPNVLVGHFPPSGHGAQDRYEIYGNFFYENPSEALFQGEGNLVLHDNLFVNRSGSAVHVQPHNDRPKSVVVYHNTVIASGDGISVVGADRAFEQKIIANAVFASRPIVGPGQMENVVGGPDDARRYLVAPSASMGSLDLHPRQGQLSGPLVNLRPLGHFQDSARDFEGRGRTGRVRGAYETSGGEGGWKLALEPKPAYEGD
jgi:hypothetical protein